MGKTYKRNQSWKPPKCGKDFKNFKKSNKFKNWSDKPHHILKSGEVDKNITIE